MPKISLKDNSPEFKDNKKSDKKIICDMPGCSEIACHKAPKDRGLREYYNFCLPHAQEYNKAWDFFEGMSESEVENHIIKSFYGDRPTWQSSLNSKNLEDELRNKVEQNFFEEDNSQTKENYNQKRQERAAFNTPEMEAMSIMGLDPPVTLEEIKARYKSLAKKYHPDLNKDNQNAEELLKRINMAYTILKMAFAEYKKIVKE